MTALILKIVLFISRCNVLCNSKSVICNYLYFKKLCKLLADLTVSVTS